MSAVFAHSHSSSTSSSLHLQGMRRPVDEEDEQESRTLMLGVRRTLSTHQNHSSGNSSPNQSHRQSRINPQQRQKLSPQEPVAVGGRKILLQRVEDSAGEEETDYVHFDPATMSWSGNPQPAVSTSLPNRVDDKNGLMGHNRLATGFKRPQRRMARNTGPARANRASSNSTTERGSG